MDTFAERLAQLQAKHHRDLANVIATLDEYNSEDFTTTVSTVLKFTSLTPVEFGDANAVSEGTVGRWASGRVVPAPIIRRAIRNYLVGELNRRADMIEAFPKQLGTPKDASSLHSDLPPEAQRPR